MTHSEMTVGRFKELLLTYGGELQRWPEAERITAEAFVASSAQAQSLLAEYTPVDALMQAGKNDKAPSGLLDRIMDATKDE